MKVLSNCLIAVILLFLPKLSYSTAGRDVVTNTVSCVGNNLTCNQKMSINTIGELISIDTTSVNFKNYKKIKSDRDIDFYFPQIGTMLGFKFIPTVGELKGDEIKVIAMSKIGINAQEQSRIIFYRQLQDEHQWSEVGTVIIKKASQPLNTIEAHVTLKPTGTVEFRKEDGSLAQIFVGKRILLPETAGRN